jgi:hypothetical protein
MLNYPTLDPHLVSRLLPLAERLNDLAESGAECSIERAEFNTLAGTTIDEPLVFHFAGTCSAETFVRGMLARGHVRDFVGLSDAQLHDVVGGVLRGDRPTEVEFWLEVLELNLPGAPISDLLFYPQEALASLGVDSQTELTIENILRLARASASV